MKEKWLSIIPHVSSKHSWKLGWKHFKKCVHHRLSRREKKQVPWLKPGSPALVALEEVVNNKRLLKDIEKLTEFHHTGELDIFHSLMLKYQNKCTSATDECWHILNLQHLITTIIAIGFKLYLSRVETRSAAIQG
ncbi:Hypothetical predicted protein [Paramuricea clavata]|uniref:Uncharacterized protein n=1 Tax=Paramuricea clavata TaxID=317549 RepID=A0A6S7FSG2_PARCT|nr:Hypothetical predicted protein [Paramuricea clavata]